MSLVDRLWSVVAPIRVLPGIPVLIPQPLPETPEYIDARTEARALCRNLGLDVDNEHWDGASVSDFIRLAYAQGWKACETRINSPDIADAIMMAIQNPGAIVDQPGYLGGTGEIRWQVQAVQRAVVHGVPK